MLRQVPRALVVLVRVLLVLLALLLVLVQVLVLATTVSMRLCRLRATRGRLRLPLLPFDRFPCVP